MNGKAAAALGLVLLSLTTWAVASVATHGQLLSDHDARIVSLERAQQQTVEMRRDLARTREEMSGLRAELRALSAQLKEDR